MQKRLNAMLQNLETLGSWHS